MTDINIQEDMENVNIQIEKLVGELNKINSTREGVVQQIQNLNGVLMYLRGKQPPEDSPIEATKEETLERTDEYPEE